MSLNRTVICRGTRCELFNKMEKSRQHFPTQDVLSSSPRLRDWEGPSRWTEYLSQEMTPPVSSRTSRNVGSEGTAQSSGGSHKGLNMQWVYQLTQVAQGLMAKMYRLNQILDYPDSMGHVFSEAFWKAGVFPNHPKLCVFLSKKFPEHHSRLQVERVSNWDYCSWIVFLELLKIATSDFCFQWELAIGW